MINVGTLLVTVRLRCDTMMKRRHVTVLRRILRGQKQVTVVQVSPFTTVTAVTVATQARTELVIPSPRAESNF